VLFCLQQGEHCLKQEAKAAINAIICSGTALVATSNPQVEISAQQPDVLHTPWLGKC
jgi:hypothetical protein